MIRAPSASPVELAVLLERRRAILDQPFLVLRNRALQECDVNWLGRRLRPFMPGQQPAAAPQDRCQRDGDDARAPRVMEQYDERSRHECRGEGDQVNAAYRRQRRERRVALRVAKLQPWKPGEEPAAQPLHQRPARRNQQQRPRRRGIGRDAHDDVAEQRVVRPLDREQRSHQEDCEPGGRVAEIVDRRVDPPGAGSEERGAEPESRARGIPRRRVFPEQEKHCGPEPGEEVEAIGRERE